MGEVRLRRDQDAVGSLGELIKKFPKSEFLADAHYWRGMLLKAQEKSHDAEEEFRLCLKASPRKDLAREAQFHLGHLLYSNGRHQDAAEIFHPLLSSPLRDKFSPSLLQWLAEFSLEQKNYPGALSAARALVAVRSEPGWQQIGLGLIGRTQMAQGNRAEAETSFTKCLAVEARTPLAAEAALRLGEIASGKKDHPSASKHFEQAARLASGDDLLAVRARAYMGLAQAAEAQEDFGSAVRYFMSVAVLYDDEQLVSECLYGAVKGFREIGRDEEAAAAARELTDRYPNSRWAVKIGKEQGPEAGKGAASKP